MSKFLKLQIQALGLQEGKPSQCPACVPQSGSGVM